MELLPSTSGAGWPFMVAGLSLVAILMVIPVALRTYLKIKNEAESHYILLQTNTEFRMLLGFMLVLLGTAVFASIGWIRSLITEAGEFGDLALFSRWSRWWILPPNSLMFCFGLALILWDGLERRGEHICLALILLAAILWGIGAYGGDYIISWWWGG